MKLRKLDEKQLKMLRGIFEARFEACQEKMKEIREDPHASYANPEDNSSYYTAYGRAEAYDFCLAALTDTGWWD
jgi:hypothetical protein